MEGISRGLPVRVVDEYRIWDRLRVESSMPLYQLSWKDYSHDGSFVSRVSQSVWLDFLVNSGTVDSSNGIFSYFHSGPVDWFKNPYLYIYVISVADLDSYREKQRMRLHVFAEACREKKVEYLIVYSPPSTAPLAAALNTTNSNVSSLSLRMFSEEDPAQKARRKVFERLKTELNVIKGRETVVKLEQGGTVPAFFVHRLRECIVSAIEQRVKGYRKELDKYLQSKSSPGWNLQKLVALEESLAFVYYQAGHLESSLKCYQNVQDVLQNNKMKVFRQASTKISSARQVLYYGCEEIRTLLCQSRLGELEVLSYIFSRQFALLYSLRIFGDIPKLVFNYISNIYQRTNYVNEEAENFFIQAWIFCCCGALRDSSYIPRDNNADELEEDADIEHSFPAYFSADFIAKLIFIQLLCFSNFLRSKYSKISAEVPCIYLDLEKIFVDSRKQLAMDDGILNEDETLSHHLESLENGCMEFIGLCRNLTELLSKSGRRRLVSEMRGYYGVTLATFGRLEEARQVLEAECSMLSSEHWNLLLFDRLSWLARTEKDLGRLPEYLTSCLSILHNLCDLQRNCSEHIMKKLRQEASFWIGEVNELCKTVPETVSYRLDKIFRSCRIMTKLQSEEIFQFDPLSLDISLESELPSGIYVEKCIVILAEQSEGLKDTEHRRLQLESNDSFDILPGSNIISVITDSLELCGVLFVESIHLKMHNLNLIWTAKDPLDAFFPLFTCLIVHERPPLGRVILQSCSECYTNNGKFFVDQDVEIEASQHSSVEGSHILIGFCKHSKDQISLKLPSIEAGDTYRLTASIPVPKENFNLLRVIQTTGEPSHYKQSMILFATLVGKEILSSGEEKRFHYRTEKEVDIMFPFSIGIQCKTLLFDDNTVKFILTCSCCSSLVSRFVALQILSMSVPELHVDTRNEDSHLYSFHFRKPFERRFFLLKLVSEVDRLRSMLKATEESFSLSCCISKHNESFNNTNSMQLRCPFPFASLVPSYVFRVEYKYDDTCQPLQGCEFPLRISLKLIRLDGEETFGEGFGYLIDNDSVGWIIVGKSRGFLPHNQSAVDLVVTLVPVLSGILYLPSFSLYYNGERVRSQNIYQVDCSRQVIVRPPVHLLSPSVS
ncbi:hypothetical protein GpartN1_g4942.t1 [Galdieria partita]|uniref:TRAPPC10/Trs130 N-terminal domain-containing protein n=1 Tax=Galdieria partita TaxID=83374 RepID=A0A9C7URR9_9RHOD|nr:hypothetical protein GpartN1_g4942.t1 [Galdieria partita]